MRRPCLILCLIIALMLSGCARMHHDLAQTWDRTSARFAEHRRGWRDATDRWCAEHPVIGATAGGVMVGSAIVLVTAAIVAVWILEGQADRE
jgi:uncharacterized protein YceK